MADQNAESNVNSGGKAHEVSGGIRTMLETVLEVLYKAFW